MIVSFKDIAKVLNSSFAEPIVTSPLPEDVEKTIAQFVSTHPTIEDHDSQRIHEDLLSIFHKHVAGNTEKHGPFVAVLRLLRPVIRGEKRLDEWWRLVIRPTIDAIGHKRDTIEDAREFLLSILCFTIEDDTNGDKALVSSIFTKKVIDAYLARTRLPSGDDVVSPENEFLAQELETILVTFGRKNPKELLVAVDAIFVDRDRRLQALSLLSSFVRLQPPNLSLVLQTSLISHLHTCLLLDNSSTVVDLALTILIMFMPHITTTLTADIPRLFLIYSRILCWDQYNKEDAGHTTRSEYSGSEYAYDAESKQTLHFDPHWDVIEATMDGIGSPAPKANYLFTFLYGIFPINFMNYIRKPRRYLKMKSYQRADDLDLHQGLIRTRTEAHRAQHRLHPNFFNTTLEEELTDNRLLKTDAADLVSGCLGLCITAVMKLGNPGPPPSQKLPALPKKSRSVKSRVTITPGDEETLGNAFSTNVEGRQSRPSSSNRHTLNTTLTGTTINHSMDHSRMPPRQSSHTSLVEFSRSPKSGSPMNRFLLSDDGPESPIGTQPQTPRLDRLPLTTSAPPSPPRSIINANSMPKLPSLQSFAQTLSRFPVPQSTSLGEDAYSTAILQREVMLLKNDLNFERYQKQKYIEQMSNLQRKNIGEAAMEADGQTLMNKNRSMKAHLSRSDERYDQLKKEMTVSRNQAKKFEDQLTSKLRAYREEEKQWKLDIQALQHDLDMTKMECDDLKKLVIESEAREEEGANELLIHSVGIDEVHALRSKIAELEHKLDVYKQRNFDFERTLEEHHILQAELETTRMKLASSDAERDRTRRQYEQRIIILEAHNRTAHTAHNGSSTLPKSVQQMIDSAVALQQSKFSQLKKNYTNLHSRFQDLEMRNQELESSSAAAMGTPRSGSVLSLTRYADDSALPSSSSVARDSFTSGSHLARSRSMRRHDFALNEALIEEPTSGMVRTASGGLAANTTNPIRSSEFARGSSNVQEYVTNPTELAPPEGWGGRNSSMPLPAGKPVETRTFGRGGAGNMKKANKDKDKESAANAKKGGFRGLKNIM